MKIAVIGLGSMGRRRIRLLKEVCHNCTIYGADHNKERCRKVYEEYGIKIYTDLKELFEDESVRLDAAVIAAPPLSHAQIIRECLLAGLHVFTEINLVSNQYEENMQLAASKGKVLFLSSTFLYREEIRYIRERVQCSRHPVNYNYHVGQYLPDWHPWESYKDFFVSSKETNGCREIFAIELPWLLDVFGQVKDFRLMKGTSSSLKIDYPDTYHLLMYHESGTIGSFEVDVVSRKAVRNLEVYGEDLYLTWDGTPEGLKRYHFDSKRAERIDLYEDAQHVDGYGSFIIENAYKNELCTFLEEISGKKTAVYGFKEDLETLKLIDKIEGKI